MVVIVRNTASEVRGNSAQRAIWRWALPRESASSNSRQHSSRFSTSTSTTTIMDSPVTAPLSPKLPPELILDILEIACCLQSTLPWSNCTRFSLACVCKWASSACYARLYSAIVLNDPITLKKLIAAYPAPLINTKTLVISLPVPRQGLTEVEDNAPLIVKLMDHCPKLKHLVVNNAMLRSIARSGRNHARPTSITSFQDHWGFGRRIFPGVYGVYFLRTFINVTHVELPTPPWYLYLSETIEAMPKVTHLAFNIPRHLDGALFPRDGIQHNYSSEVHGRIQRFVVRLTGEPEWQWPDLMRIWLRHVMAMGWPLERCAVVFDKQLDFLNPETEYEDIWIRAEKHLQGLPST